MQREMVGCCVLLFLLPSWQQSNQAPELFWLSCRNNLAQLLTKVVTPTPCVLVLYTSVPDHNSILEQLNPQWNGKKPVIVAHEICCNTVNETLSSELSNMASHCSIPNIVSRNLQDLFSERLDHYLFGSVALDRNYHLYQPEQYIARFNAFLELLTDELCTKPQSFSWPPFQFSSDYRETTDFIPMNWNSEDNITSLQHYISSYKMPTFTTNTKATKQACEDFLQYCSDSFNFNLSTSTILATRVRDIFKTESSENGTLRRIASLIQLDETQIPWGLAFSELFWLLAQQVDSRQVYFSPCPGEPIHLLEVTRYRTPAKRIRTTITERCHEKKSPPQSEMRLPPSKKRLVMSSAALHSPALAAALANELEQESRFSKWLGGVQIEYRVPKQ